MSSHSWGIDADHCVRIEEGSPDTNFDVAEPDACIIGSSSADKGQSFDSLYIYDFSGMIPAGSTINSAQLRVYGTARAGDPSLQTWQMTRIQTEWAVETVTWTTRPIQDDTVRDEDAGINTIGGWDTVDIPIVVNDAIDNRSSVLDLYVHQVTVDDDVWLQTTRGAYLDIDWTPPGAPSIKAISGVAWGSVKKVSGVAEASIKKVSGVSAQ